MASGPANSGSGGERLYFNAWWTATEEGSRYRYSKHIFVGSERIVTRLRASTGNWAAEDATTYWYHPDHLGSTSVVTDPDGEAYERIDVHALRGDVAGASA